MLNCAMQGSSTDKTAALLCMAIPLLPTNGTLIVNIHQLQVSTATAKWALVGTQVHKVGALTSTTQRLTRGVRSA